MLIDASHWTVAFLIAVSVHFAGIMWLEPTQDTPLPQQELSSERIVVRLGTDSGSVAAAATLLGNPEESAPLEPSETTSDAALASVQKPSVEDIETPVKEVSVATVIRRTFEMETAATTASRDVPVLAPEREISGVDQTASSKTLVPPADENVEAQQAVVLAPTVANESAVSTPGLVSTQIEADKEQATEIIAAPLPQGTAQAEDPNLTLTQTGSSVEEETDQSEVELVLAEAKPLSAVQSQQPVESMASRLEDVEESTVSTAIDAVEPRPVQSAAIAPMELIARAITLEELHDISGVSARYAGLLKGWLRENMHYPRAARLAGQEGRAIVHFVIDRSGKVSSIQLEQSSGHRILDREAVEMIERADPFPIMPAEMAGTKLELRVPVVFEIHAESLNRQIPPIFLE